MGETHDQPNESPTKMIIFRLALRGGRAQKQLLCGRLNVSAWVDRSHHEKQGFYVVLRACGVVLGGGRGGHGRQAKRGRDPTAVP